MSGSNAAPWSLAGKGLIVVLRGASLQGNTFGLANSQSNGLKSAFKVLMWVDYQTAPCGPYQELLLIPGSVAFSSGRHLTISDIWVSSRQSVLDGRANWGIPKQLASFEELINADLTPEGISFRVKSEGDEALLELSCQPMGPSLPLKTSWVPARFRSLAQQLNGREYVFSPSASGRIRAAKVASVVQASGVFSGLTRKDVLAAFCIPQFSMEFPEPEILEL